MNIFILLLMALLAPAGANPVVEIRADYTQKGWPQQLRAYQAAGTVPGSLGGMVASDSSFEKAGGKKPTVMVFPADYDGDGTDEIVTVRMQKVKKKYDYRLRIYRPPLFLDGNTGKPVASTSKKSLGSPTGDGRVLLVGGFDLGGKSRDEAFVIRQWNDGSQSLEIRRLPTKTNKEMKPAFASDASFGSANYDENVSACGADVDGDDRDEIVVLRRSNSGPDQLLVFQAPDELDGETGAPILSDLDITPADGGQNIDISRMDIDGDGVDELALRRIHATTGQRLEVVSFPGGVGGEIGPPLFTEPNLQPLGSNYAVVRVFGIRGYTANPPQPPSDLSGTYQATMSHQADGSPESMPPLGDLLAPQVGAGTFVINMPTFFPLVGAYSQKDARIDFGTALNKLKVVSTGDLYWLSYGLATVSFEQGKLTIKGTYSGVKDQVSGPNQAITNGVYSFTQK